MIGEVAAWCIRSGDLLWKQGVGTETDSLVLVDRILCARTKGMRHHGPSRDEGNLRILGPIEFAAPGAVFGFNAKTGELLWKRSTHEYELDSGLLIAAGDAI